MNVSSLRDGVQLGLYCRRCNRGSLRFPYGGENYSGMRLSYAAKSNEISIYWPMNGRCFRDNLQWNGATVEQALGRMDLGAEDVCYRL